MQPIIKTDQARKLVCNIQGGAGSATTIDHLNDGVKLGLKGSIEKHSEILGWVPARRKSEGFIVGG